MSATEKQISIQDMQELNYKEREEFWSYFGKEWEKEKEKEKEEMKGERYEQ